MTAIDLLFEGDGQKDLLKLQNHSVGTWILFGMDMFGCLFVAYNTPYTYRVGFGVGTNRSGKW